MKRISICFIILFILIIGNTYSQENIDYSKIRTIINIIKTNDPTKISEVIRYPLPRDFPLPNILSKEDFIKHYDEIFDDSLINKVSLSDPEKDWQAIGWRGVQFDSGTIWLNSFKDYKITNINYENKKLISIKDHYFNLYKESLPINLQNIESQFFVFNSTNHIINVDIIKKDNYRLLIRSKDTLKIEIILSNGSFNFDGNIGDYHIDWLYKDKVYRFELSDETYYLKVYSKVKLDNNFECEPEYIENELTRT